MKASTLAKTALIYTVAALASGVFFREFTKFNDFTGQTALGVTHVHLFVLGTVFFLVLAGLGLATNLLQQKRFKTFFVLHNIALPLCVVMFYVRGIVEVLGLSAPDAAIAGMAGLTHIALAVSLVLACLCVIKAVREREEQIASR